MTLTESVSCAPHLTGRSSGAQQRAEHVAETTPDCGVEVFFCFLLFFSLPGVFYSICGEKNKHLKLLFDIIIFLELNDKEVATQKHSVI